MLSAVQPQYGEGGKEQGGQGEFELPHVVVSTCSLLAATAAAAVSTCRNVGACKKVCRRRLQKREQAAGQAATEALAACARQLLCNHTWHDTCSTNSRPTHQQSHRVPDMRQGPGDEAHAAPHMVQGGPINSAKQWGASIITSLRQSIEQVEHVAPLNKGFGPFGTGESLISQAPHGRGWFATCGSSPAMPWAL